MTRREAARALAAATAAVVPGLGAAVETATTSGDQTASEWRTLEGAWSLSGTRQTLPTERGIDAAIVHLSGAVSLSGTGGLGRGFHGEVIGYDDAGDARAGRWVWTDDEGDRVYGKLSGEPMATGRRFTATITGGSGRYAGVTGDFVCTWQYVVTPEAGAVAGRATRLVGRVRAGGPTR